MAELSEGWNGPFEATIVLSAPQQFEGQEQWKGAFPPFKGVLQWNCKVAYTGGDKQVFAIYHSPEKPTDGMKLDGAFIEHKAKRDKPGKFTTVLYSAEQRGDKKAAGGFGGGAKPNYSLEQEAMKDGLLIAVTGLSVGAFYDADGKPLVCSGTNLKNLGGFIAKMILEAGK